MIARVHIDAETERAVRLFINKVADDYDLVEAVLFGSRARRDHRPDSDADLAVVLRGPRGVFLDTKLDLADVAYDVFLETGVLIQPFPVWEDDWTHPERHGNPVLLENIGREGVHLCNLPI